MNLKECWIETWSDLGVNDSPELQKLLSNLLVRYAEPHRHYHTQQHLDECFEKLRNIIALADRPAEVRAALWFHDAIYDTQRHDNEERSAELARDSANQLGSSTETAKRLYDLVLVTRHAAEPASIDGQVLVDVDLSILGAGPARFEEYESQVRREYGWVPEETFRSARAAILKQFLSRPQLFFTPYFIERYEAQARRNLRRSIQRLEA